METGGVLGGKSGVSGKPFLNRCAITGLFLFYPSLFFRFFPTHFVLAFVSGERFFPYGCVAMCPRNLFLLSAMCELLSAICCKFKVLKRLRRATESEKMSRIHTK